MESYSLHKNNKKCGAYAVVFKSESREGIVSAGLDMQTAVNLREQCKEYSKGTYYRVVKTLTKG